MGNATLGICLDQFIHIVYIRALKRPYKINYYVLDVKHTRVVYDTLPARPPEPVVFRTQPV